MTELTVFDRWMREQDKWGYEESPSLVRDFNNFAEFVKRDAIKEVIKLSKYRLLYNGDGTAVNGGFVSVKEVKELLEVQE